MVKVWWAVSDGRADGMDVGYSPVCVYSWLVPSSFIMNGLGIGLVEKLCLSHWIIHTNCISFSHCTYMINIS